MKIAVVYSYAPQEGIINGLRTRENLVVTFFYGIEKPSIWQKINWKLNGKPDTYITKQFNNQLKHLYIHHQKEPFDFIIIIKGKKINKDSESILLKLKDVYKILWTTDSVIRFPDQLSVKKYMDKIFVQDGSDVGLIKGSSWLPLGFDKNVYTYKKKKTIDILLFGNCKLEYYSKRLHYFMAASKLAHKYKITFVGSNLSETKKNELESNGVNVYQTAPFYKFVELVTNAKICINIHQDDGEKAINPLFFAIPACGSVQVTDQRSYYSDWLLSNRDYFPVKINELNFLLDKILNNFAEYQLNEIEAKAVSDKHSFNARAQILLNTLTLDEVS